MPEHLALYEAIDEILWRDWDPIGISDAKDTRDEYRMYLPPVYRLALTADRAKVADTLFAIASERMGLTTQRDQHLAVADKILAAKAMLESISNESMGPLWVIQVADSTPENPSYCVVKHSQDLCYLPTWLSAEQAAAYISENRISGSVPVTLSRSGYEKVLKWHRDSGYDLLIKLHA